MNVDLYQHKIAVNLFGAAYGPQNKDRAMSFYYGPRGEKKLSFEFPTNCDSNQILLLQRLTRKFKIQI